MHRGVNVYLCACSVHMQKRGEILNIPAEEISFLLCRRRKTTLLKRDSLCSFIPKFFQRAGAGVAGRPQK